MLLSFFGGFLLGSSMAVLYQRDPLYPKPIAVVSMLAGIGLIIWELASPGL